MMFKFKNTENGKEVNEDASLRATEEVVELEDKGWAENVQQNEGTGRSPGK